jgi:hypothetical protein
MGILPEYGVHNGALYARPPTVNDANLTKAALTGLKEVLLHQAGDLPGLVGVQIDPVFDRYGNSIPGIL